MSARAEKREREGGEKIESVEERRKTGEELYRRYMAGDENSFEEIVAMYENELAHFIYGIVGDYHESKHLTIETFARLAVGGEKFGEKSSLKTYVFAIGKHLAVRHVKKRANERHLSFEEAAGVFAGESESPYDMLEREENRRLLHGAMEGLKENYRAVLLLLYFEDMSYIQAGEIMNKSERQIRDLAYRAKAALKKKLESEGFTYG